MASLFHQSSFLHQFISTIDTDEPVYILMRHAEKHAYNYTLESGKVEAIKQDYMDDHLLSPKGYERAHALVSYFLDRNEMQALFSKCPLAGIYAQDVDTLPNPKGQSKRPLETVIPLWNAIQSSHAYPSPCSRSQACLDRPLLKKGIQLYTKRRMKHMIQSCQSKELYAGKSIIICWSHQTLPQLARELGAVNVPEWKGKRYDMTWLVHKQQLVQLPQLLMYGDVPSLFDTETIGNKDQDD